MKFTPSPILLKNNKTASIREALLTDAEELIAVTKRYLQESTYLCSHADDFNPTIEDETFWVASHQSTNSILLVASYDGNIIGTLSLLGDEKRKLAHTGAISIAILTEWQNQGLGTTFFEMATDWARENSILELLYLDVFADNSGGIALYEKFGFIKEGHIKNFYKCADGRYNDNLMMTLDVNKKK